MTKKSVDMSEDKDDKDDKDLERQSPKVLWRHALKVPTHQEGER